MTGSDEMKNLPSKVILIGCGSIGEKYLAYIGSMRVKCVVIDPKKDFISQKFQYEDDLITWISDLSLIPKVFLDTNSVAIIANWGPDHFKTFTSLVSLNVKNFIIEKPIVSKMNHLVALEKIILKKQLSVVINQGWESNHYSENLIRIFDSLDLSEPEMMIVQGGARCIATAGSHYIQVAQRLFRSEPRNVFANLYNNQINPRHSNLSYLQGVLAIEFFPNKYLSVNFSNQSSIEGSVNLYWRDAFATIIQNNIVINKLSPTREFADVVTRYSTPNTKAYDSFIVENNFDSSYAIQFLFDKVLTGQQNSLHDLKLHLSTTKLLLLSLISNDLQKRLPFNHKMLGKYFWKDYRIS